MNAPTRTSRELVWPPPQEELDALEVVHLRSPAPTWTPSTTHAPSGPSSRAPLVEPTSGPPRSRVPRILTIAALMLLAMMAGVWLGALHAQRSIAVANFSPASPAPARESAPAAPERVDTPASSPAPSSPPAEPNASAAAAEGAPLASSSPVPPPNATFSTTAEPPVAPAAPAAAVPSPSTDVSSTAAAPSASPSEASPPSTALPEAKPLTDIPGARSLLPPPVTPARRAEAAGIVVSGPDEAGVKRTLTEYRRAYDALDANAAAARWPSVDVAALTRAFSGLKAQSLVFDRCQLLVGTSTARASCTGSTTVVRQVGSARPVTESLQWTFTLRRSASDWVIDRVQTDNVEATRRPRE